MIEEISPDEFSPIIREYVAYMSTIKNSSSKTVSEYLLDLRTFFRFLLAQDQGIKPKTKEFFELDISTVDLEKIKSVTETDVMNFLLYTKEDRENEWSARARKLSAIRSLFRYLTGIKNYFPHNPCTNIESPKPKRTLPKVLSEEEAILLLETVENDTDSPFRIRDYAIITLFLNCGMRVSELVGINFADIDSEMQFIRITGKGSKEREVFLNDACKKALGDYLDERILLKQKIPNEKAVFVSKFMQRMSVKTVQATVYKYLNMAGLQAKGYSVHKLRHTAATLMYQVGNVDVRVLKDILGHEQLNTTQIYTHVNATSIAEAMQKNPLADRTRKK